MAAQTVRAQSQEETRERLLIAAEKLVAAQGLGGVSVNDIATAAGFTKGAFYSNFDSREDIAIALVRRLRTRQLRMLENQLRLAEADLTAALDGFADYAARLAENPIALLTAELQLAARRDPALEQAAADGFSAQVDILAQWAKLVARAARVSPDLSPRRIARLLLAAAQGLAQQPGDSSRVTVIMRDLLRAYFHA